MQVNVGSAAERFEPSCLQGKSSLFRRLYENCRIHLLALFQAAILNV